MGSNIGSGWPQQEFLNKNNFSLKKLISFGYFDRFGNFREITNKKALEKKYNIKLTTPLPEILKKSKFNFETYQYNQKLLPNLSIERRLNYLILNRKIKDYDLLHFLKTKKIYYHFSSPKNKSFYEDQGDEYNLTPTKMPSILDSNARKAIKLFSDIFDIEFIQVSDKEIHNYNNQNADKTLKTLIPLKAKPLLINYFTSTDPVIVSNALAGGLTLDNNNFIDLSIYGVKGSQYSIKNQSSIFCLFLHELSHILLEHSFSETDFFYDENDTLIKSWDFLQENNMFSIMSYTLHELFSQIDNRLRHAIEPTTFMYDDLVALREFLNFNPSYQKGNSSYNVSSSKISLQTITDRGGNDHLSYKDHLYSWINLSKQGISSGNIPFSRCIGPYTDIENATGGKEFAFFYGNDLDNDVAAQKNGVFITGPGNDIHREGSGHNVHFYALGTGQENIYSQNGFSEIHLFHYEKSDLSYEINNNGFTLYHAQSKDQITYKSKGNLNLENIVFYLNNRKYKLTDFQKHTPSKKDTIFLLKSDEIHFSQNQEKKLTDLFPDLPPNHIVELISKTETVKDKASKIVIKGGDGTKNQIQTFSLKIPKLDYNNRFKIYTSIIQPKITVKKYYQKNTQNFNLSDVLDIETPLKIKKYILKSDKGFYAEGDNLLNIALPSYPNQDNYLCKYQLKIIYEKNSLTSFSFGILYRKNHLPKAEAEIGYFYNSPRIKLDADFFNNHLYRDADGDPIAKVEAIFTAFPKQVTFNLEDATNNKNSKKIAIDANNPILFNPDKKTLILSNLPKTFDINYKIRFFDGTGWSNMSENNFIQE